MRGPDERTRADEYHGREAVKQSTRAAQEEFSADAALTAEPADADLRDPSLYINRELSLLEFNRRVLDEARDAATRCWSVSSSWPSSPPTWTSSSWSAWPASSSRSRPAWPSVRRTGYTPPSSWGRRADARRAS